MRCREDAAGDEMRGATRLGGDTIALGVALSLSFVPVEDSDILRLDLCGVLLMERGVCFFSLAMAVVDCKYSLQPKPQERTLCPK
jgi:hypothetical protein